MRTLNIVVLYLILYNSKINILFYIQKNNDIIYYMILDKINYIKMNLRKYIENILIKIGIPEESFKYFFQYYYSWILIPLLPILYYNYPLIRPAITVYMFIVAILGTILTLLIPEKIPNLMFLIIRIIFIFFHLIVLVPIFMKSSYIKTKKNKNENKNENESTNEKKVTFSNKNKYFYYTTEFNKLLQINYYNFALFLLGIYLITSFPSWPYFWVTRKLVLILFVLIVVSLWLIGEFINLNNYVPY